MARIRSIKPDFFSDTRLAEASITARFFYVGLFCQFDCNGLTEADPKLLKREIFPYDESITPKKVQGLLEELVNLGRVIRFEHQGKEYLFCPAFTRHQRFHRNETPKYAIPKETIFTPSQTDSAPSQHGAKTVLAPSQTAGDIDPLYSCNLKSGDVEQYPGEVLVAPKGDPLGTGSETGAGSSGLTPGRGVGRRVHPLIEIWNENRGSLPEAKNCKGKRQIETEKRWRENPDPSHWVEVVRRMASSAFLRGEKSDRGWIASFDFLVRDGTDTGVLEGKYDDRQGAGYRPFILNTQEDVR